MIRRYARVALAAVLGTAAALFLLANPAVMGRIDKAYLSAGDEVFTKDGYHGQVVSFGSDDVELRLAGDKRIRVKRDTVWEP